MWAGAGGLNLNAARSQQIRDQPQPAATANPSSMHRQVAHNSDKQGKGAFCEFGDIRVPIGLYNTPANQSRISCLKKIYHHHHHQPEGFEFFNSWRRLIRILLQYRTTTMLAMTILVHFWVVYWVTWPAIGTLLSNLPNYTAAYLLSPEGSRVNSCRSGDAHVLAHACLVVPCPTQTLCGSVLLG